MAASNPNRIYALIETSDGDPVHGARGERGELWRSDDGGANWQVVSHDRQLAGRTQYYSRMAVIPDNENEAYSFRGVQQDPRRRKDHDRSALRRDPGGDHHDIWIDPTNANRMTVGHDGGISISTNRGKNWLRVAAARRPDVSRHDG